jgi:hypothetical protein
MAKQVVVNLVDDLDGSKAVSTIRFALDGTEWEIDLNGKNESQMRRDLAKYLDAARRVRAEASSSMRRGANPKTDRERNTAIREWARSEGAELATRGRIPMAVQAAYARKDGDALRNALGLELVGKAPRKRR